MVMKKRHAPARRKPQRAHAEEPVDEHEEEDEMTVHEQEQHEVSQREDGPPKRPTLTWMGPPIAAGGPEGEAREVPLVQEIKHWNGLAFPLGVPVSIAHLSPLLVHSMVTAAAGNEAWTVEMPE